MGIYSPLTQWEVWEEVFAGISSAAKGYPSPGVWDSLSFLLPVFRWLHQCQLSFSSQAGGKETVNGKRAWTCWVYSYRSSFSGRSVNCIYIYLTRSTSLGLHCLREGHLDEGVGLVWFLKLSPLLLTRKSGLSKDEENE